MGRREWTILLGFILALVASAGLPALGVRLLGSRAVLPPEAAAGPEADPEGDARAERSGSHRVDRAAADAGAFGLGCFLWLVVLWATRRQSSRSGWSVALGVFVSGLPALTAMALVRSGAIWVARDWRVELSRLSGLAAWLVFSAAWAAALRPGPTRGA